MPREWCCHPSAIPASVLGLLVGTGANAGGCWGEPGRVTGPHGHGAARCQLLLSTGCGPVPPRAAGQGVGRELSPWEGSSTAPPGSRGASGSWPQRGNGARETRTPAATSARSLGFWRRAARARGQACPQHTATIQPRCRNRPCVNSPVAAVNEPFFLLLSPGRRVQGALPTAAFPPSASHQCALRGWRGARRGAAGSGVPSAIRAPQ